MSCRGVTLIELVLVIVLIGIAAVFLAPKLGDLSATRAGVFREKLRADIRYAQNLAMTGSRRARVTFNGTGSAPAAGYAVTADSSASGDCSSFAPAVDPAAGGVLSVVLNAGNYAGITVTPGANCLEFDSFGRPYDCSAGPAVCSAAAGSVIVTINPSGSVTIAAQTGAVN